MRLRTMPNKNVSLVPIFTLDSDSESEEISKTPISIDDSDVIVLDETKDEVMSDIEILSSDISSRNCEPAAFPIKVDKTPECVLASKAPDFIPINMKQKKKKKNKKPPSLEMVKIAKLSENSKIIKKKHGNGKNQKSQLLNKLEVKTSENGNQQSTKTETKSDNINDKKEKTNETHRNRSIFSYLPKITPTIQLNHSNILNMDTVHPTEGLRPIIIDGCNVAFGHGNGTFSMDGITFVIRYFKNRGHKEIVCFLPQRYRHRWNLEAEKKEILQYEKEKIFVYTPSRKLGDGSYITPYDDRFIVQYATERGGVIISNDGYRDLINEEPSWRTTIEKRIINFTFAPGVFMLPKDPLGRDGPTLDEILKFP